MSLTMKIEPVYLKAIGLKTFQHPSGDNGKIIGIEMLTPKGLEPRLCYKVSWEDSEMPEGCLIDYVPISSVEYGTYSIVLTK